MSVYADPDEVVLQLSNRAAREAKVRREILVALDRMPAVDSYEDIQGAAWEALRGETDLMRELLPVFPYQGVGYGDLATVQAPLVRVPNNPGETWGSMYKPATPDAPKDFIRAIVAQRCAALSTGMYIHPVAGTPARRVLQQDEKIAWAFGVDGVSHIHAPQITPRIIRAIDLAHGATAPAMTINLYVGAYGRVGDSFMMAAVTPANISARKCFAPLFTALDMLSCDPASTNIETERLRDVVIGLEKAGSLQECFVKWRRSRRIIRNMTAARNTWVNTLDARRGASRSYSSHSISELWIDRVAEPLWRAMVSLQPGEMRGATRSSLVMAAQGLSSVMSRSISETGDVPDYDILRAMVNGMRSLIESVQQHAKDLT